MKYLPALILPVILMNQLAIAATPAYLENHQTTKADIASIEKVIEDFQTAIKTKNPKLLSTLVLNSKILFASPWPPEDINDMRRESDVNFDGISADGYGSFVRLLKSETAAIEEKFYNVKITQDANVAWVMFDFEFVRDGAVVNHGVETWQLMQAYDGKWKILSVVWSSKGKPKQ